VLSLKSFRSRTTLLAAAGLALVAGGCVLFALLDDRTSRIVAAAGVWAAAALILIPLALRARDRERRGREERELAEARHRALLDALPVVAWLTQPLPDGETLYVSPAIEELTGYEASDWRSRLDVYSRHVHPDDRERVLEELEQVQDGTPLRIEYRLLARDGRIVWVREESTTVRDATGDPQYVQTFLRDIGERKRAETEREQLLAAERQAGSATAERQSRLGLLRRAGDELAATLDYNTALPRVAELVVSEFADWCLVDVVDEGNAVKRVAVAGAEPRKLEPGATPSAEPEDGVREVVNSGRAVVIPGLGESSNGDGDGFLQGVDARSVISVPLQARRQRLGALTVARTDRAAAYGADDLALVEDLAARIAVALDRARLHREVEERADAARVLEHLGDGILLLDQRGIVRLWNPAAEAITSIDSKSVVGHPAAEAIPGWQDAVDTVPVAASPDPGHEEVVIPLETSRGERWISISGVRFFGGTVYAFRDLTDVRQLEEIKADFIATASHELRTPLAAVYGAAQTLLRHDFALDEVGRDRFVSLIADESERLGRIVNEILLANQLDSGRLDLEVEPFDAAELVERVVESTRAYAPPTVSIDVDVPEDVPRVGADIDKTRQVLVNLVENAMKYSPDGGTVQVSVEARGDLVRFAVRDEGLGIAPEDQDRIFEKFYRADPQMIRGVGGTGLGLYICKELVARMGGRIWAEANDGKGSAFFFELQAAEVFAHGGPALRRR
jgi:two-component system phosphate regulon sensor histidine kinase PhoR